MGGGDFLPVFWEGLAVDASIEGAFATLDGGRAVSWSPWKKDISGFFARASESIVCRKGTFGPGEKCGLKGSFISAEGAGLPGTLFKNIPDMSLIFRKSGGLNEAGCPSDLPSKCGISILASSIGTPENALARISGIEDGPDGGAGSPGPLLPVRKAGSLGSGDAAVDKLPPELFLMSHGNSVIETSHIRERDFYISFNIIWPGFI